MTPWGALRDDVLAALEQHGDMTAHRVATMLAVRSDNVRQVLTRLQDRKAVHVVDWCTQASGQRVYPRPIYSAGPGVNKRRPKPLTESERHRRCAARRKPINSVFAYAAHL
jgi:hypothetical protein